VGVRRRRRTGMAASTTLADTLVAVRVAAAHRTPVSTGKSTKPLRRKGLSALRSNRGRGLSISQCLMSEILGRLASLPWGALSAIAGQMRQSPAFQTYVRACARAERQKENHLSHLTQR
jgi:hypothetical protein